MNILNIMMMSVTDRTKDIGIMRSIGALKREVLSMFIYEVLILGMIGSFTGGVINFIGGYLISDLMLKTTKYLFMSSSLIQILYGQLRDSNLFNL